MLENKVGLDVSIVVGALDCDNGIDELDDVLSIVGNSVMLFKFKVGRGDSSKLVGNDVLKNASDKVKVGLADFKSVGRVVCVGESGDDSKPVGTDVFNNVCDGMLEVNVELGASKLVGELDCDDDIEELDDVLSIVGSSVILFQFKIGLDDNFKPVGTDVFNEVGDIVIFLEIVVGLDVTSLIGATDCVGDPEELEYVLYTVGDSVMFSFSIVGLNDSSISVCDRVFENVDDGVKVYSVK